MNYKIKISALKVCFMFNKSYFIQVDDAQITKSSDTFKGLSNLVLYSLPESLLTPLLNKLQLDYSAEESACKWLKSSDPALRNVVCKEALQWRKNGNAQVINLLRVRL